MMRCVHQRLRSPSNDCFTRWKTSENFDEDFNEDTPWLREMKSAQTQHKLHLNEARRNDVHVCSLHALFTINIFRVLVVDILKTTNLKVILCNWDTEECVDETHKMRKWTKKGVKMTIGSA